MSVRDGFAKQLYRMSVPGCICKTAIENVCPGMDLHNSYTVCLSWDAFANSYTEYLSQDGFAKQLYGMSVMGWIWKMATWNVCPGMNLQRSKTECLSQDGFSKQLYRISVPGWICKTAIQNVCPGMDLENSYMECLSWDAFENIL